MESSLSVSRIFLVLLLIRNSMAYDYLLKDPDAVFLSENGQKVNRTIIIDGDTSSCLYIERFYRPTLYVDFTTVKSIYEVVVYLDEIRYSNDRTIYEEPISIYVTNSSSLEDGALCNSTDMKASKKRYTTVKVQCRDHGRSITMLRLRKASFSICEITVTGCDVGMYGENCAKNCSENCVGKSCDILNGKCLSGFCSDGWQGEDCNQKCYNGTYGPWCKSQCGNCSEREDCDHVTGYCKEGCKDGSMGNKCDTACLYGTYGSNCTEKCGKCRGPKSCDKASGFCLNGCENGYFGAKCILQCPIGTYGYRCNSLCGNCKDIGDCDHETGYCNGGCAAGSMGVKCDEECPYGFFGTGCSERCNLSCGYKFEQQSIPEETHSCKITAADENKTTVYALGAALTVSLLVHIILAAMCFIRFRLKRKDEINGKPSPMYVNVSRRLREDNQPSEGMEIDQQNVQYEALGAPSQETHYDALQ